MIADSEQEEGKDKENNVEHQAQASANIFTPFYVPPEARAPAHGKPDLHYPCCFLSVVTHTLKLLSKGFQIFVTLSRVTMMAKSNCFG